MQTLYAEFEHIIHKKYESGVSLTKDLLCEEFYNLYSLYYGSSVDVHELAKYQWAGVPHFFKSYYVYQYATGFISALVIADKLENDPAFKDKYIEFLSAGSSKYPLELLSDLGIDITDENVLSHAFELFNKKLELLKNIQRGVNNGKERLL